jgi:HD superfamily phosphohydrolase
MSTQNKRKIINDPVFGFINIPTDFHYDIIQHPYFQRLNRIKQLGLASLVYPGAQHTRLQHSLGAMFLTNEAIKQLRSHGHEITNEEADAVLGAILLHDVGHGPLSHVLENSITKNISHEEISIIMMEQINREMDGKLGMALDIFNNQYPKKFLHQLLSGQLDMDRMDYLRRDSFYSGVSEGNIGSARIIKMLNLKDDQLVIEAKGIYSIEQFLIARRLMYWQVYLHKTAVAAEKMLVNILSRAKELALQDVELFASPAFHYFLYNEVDKSHFLNNPEALHYFALLDDSDLTCAIKVWASHNDIVLSTLSKNFTNRQLFKIKLMEAPISDEQIAADLEMFSKKYKISQEEARYFISSDTISSNTYTAKDDNINILYNDGTIKDIAVASDMLNISVLSKEVKKHFYCYLRT